MSDKVRRNPRLRPAAALGIAVSGGLLAAGSAVAASVSQLQNQLNATKSQLNSNQGQQKTLSGSIAAINSQVSSLTGQITLVSSREAAAQAQLGQYDTALSEDRAALTLEQVRMRLLKRELRRARRALSAELVSQYEQPAQTFVSLVIDANGFNQLLSQIQYMDNAKQSEKQIIRLTLTASLKARTAEARIRKLEAADMVAAQDATTQADALSGMNALLASRQAALNDARAAQATALAASQSKGAALQQAIKQIQQQQQAAIQAAKTISVSSSGNGSGGSGSGGGASGSGGASLGSSAGWAIPYPIVLCESGGQDLPPNSAGASGYYQIIPSTWSQFGGSGPAAYLAPKSEQDAVAARIWNGGAGASNWTCSRIVGIS